MEVFPTLDLQVTTTGQVTTAFSNEKTVTDLNVEISDDLADDRENFWMQNTVDSCLNKVRELIRYEGYDPVVVEETGTIGRDGYSVTKMKINSGNHIPVTGLMFVPDNISGTAPAVVYVDGRGKNMDAGADGVLEQIFVDSGKIVLTIDVRGFGETADNPAKNESKHGNKEHRNAVIAGYIGKTLIGQRVADIKKALDVILARQDVDTENVTLIGIDRAGSAVLHAAALDDRVTKAIIRQSFESWLPIVADPTELHNLTHVVPFSLKYYDLPDLVNTLPPDSVCYFDDPYMVITAVGELENKKGNLGQNYPNPASNMTIIPYELTESGEVTIKIYSSNGKEYMSFDQGHKMIGNHQLEVSIKNLPVGNYFYQLWVDNNSMGNKKMIVVSQ